MIDAFRRFFSVPLVWVKQKKIEGQVYYKLPDFVITDELKICFLKIHKGLNYTIIYI